VRARAPSRSPLRPAADSLPAFRSTPSPAVAGFLLNVVEPDAEVVRRAARGSEEACRELVRRYQRPIFNLVARMVRDPSVAEDLAQDTFVKAFTHLAAYDPRYRFTSWILKIAHNTAIDHLRRPRVVVPLMESEDGEMLDALAPATAEADPERAAERRDLARALDTAIDRLRPEYREVVVLRHQEELAYEEIAELLALPLGTVKSYLHRARAELAGLMTAAGWGPSGPASGGSATSNRGRP